MRIPWWMWVIGCLAPLVLIILMYSIGTSIFCDEDIIPEAF